VIKGQKIKKPCADEDDYMYKDGVFNKGHETFIEEAMEVEMVNHT
jgi:hypothetical protein